jgi:hypothetical protein
MLGMTKPILVVTSRYTKGIEDRIDRDYNARRNPNQFAFSQQKLLSAAEGADALFITPADRLDSLAGQCISIAAYRQRHDRNANSNGHAGPGQCGGSAER